VLAKPDAKPVGDWAFVERPDGARQWTYKGYPVTTQLRTACRATSTELAQSRILQLHNRR